MTTTTNKEQYTKSLKIYRAMADFAAEVFKTLDFADDLNGTLSAAEVDRYLTGKEKKIHHTKDVSEVRTFDVDGFRFSCTVGGVFSTLSRFGTSLRIKTADRVSFEVPEPAADVPTIACVTMEPYSAKAFMLKGATLQYHKALRKFGIWRKDLQAWILSNKRREYVRHLIGENLVTVAA